MPSNPIDDSATAGSWLGHTRERAKKILDLQGRGLWHGDLAEMRRDEHPVPAVEKGPDATRHK